MEFKNAITATGLVTSVGDGDFACAVGHTYVDRHSRTVTALCRLRVVTPGGVPEAVRKGICVTVKGRLYPSPENNMDFLVRAHSVREANGTAARLRTDVDLRGYIAAVETRTVGGRYKVEIRLATRESGRDGSPETTGHNVIAWAGKGVLRPATLRKGLFVRVTGHLSGRLDYGPEIQPVILDEVVADRMESEQGRI